MPRLSPAALQQMYVQTEQQSKAAKQEAILDVGETIVKEYADTLVNNGERPEIACEKAYAQAQQVESALSDQQWNVVVVLDRSGSFEDEYLDGIVGEILTRFAAICKQFDSDGVLDCYSFSDGRYACIKRNPITPQNYFNYVETEFKNEGMYGTQYAPFIRQITEDYKNAPNGLPTFVLVLTDGNNAQDKSGDPSRGILGEAEQAIVDASPYPIFWFFVGFDSKYQNGGIMSEDMVKRVFPTLARLDDLESDPNKYDNFRRTYPNRPASIRKIDNADSMGLHGTEAFSRKEVLEKLFEEAPRWLLEAKALGILPQQYQQQNRSVQQQQYQQYQPQYQPQYQQYQQPIPSAPPMPQQQNQPIPYGIPVAAPPAYDVSYQPQQYNKYSQTSPSNQSFSSKAKSLFGIGK